MNIRIFPYLCIGSSQGIVLLWAPLKSDSKDSGFFYFMGN